MRKLGQYFLTDREAAKKIIAALNLVSGDVVIEIGPGHGELTDRIRDQKSKVKIIAIEKDEQLAETLRKKFHEDACIKIIDGDALKILPQISKSYILNPRSYKIFGDIPYYITGHLLRIIGELPNKPELCVFMLQKEVAERIYAAPPKMNRLAASVQFWAKPEIITLIPPQSFRPAPKVESAIVKLLRTDADQTQADAERYYRTVRIIFAQPRKTILNNLSAAFKKSNKKEIGEKLISFGLSPRLRPQNLAVEDIRKISSVFR